MDNIGRRWGLVLFTLVGCAATDRIDGAEEIAVAGEVPGVGDKEGKEPTGEGKQPLGSQLDLVSIMTLAKDAGLPCDHLVMAGAVAMAESEGVADATNENGPTAGCPDGSRDRGIWQINDCYWPMWDDECAFDPACNASAMAAISEGGESFDLWSSVIPDGTYENWLGDAEPALASVPGCGSGPTTPGDDDTGGGTPAVAECDALGYEGTCVGAVAVWSDGPCWVRDCASEGKSCGLISPSEGYGCVEGPSGSSKQDCADLGYHGACYGDVLAWVEDGACNVVDCSATNRDCVFAGDAIGFDCD